MNPIQVMLLEDDIRASYTLESAINQHASFQVIAVTETCAEALRMYDVYRPTLVFVDLTLPDGDGLDVVRRLHTHHADCHFMITTAERDVATVEKSVQLGVRDYLVKPYRLSRIHQALDDFLRYCQTVQRTQTVNQRDIDQLLGKSTAPTTRRRTPKGIDETTLNTLKHLLDTQGMDHFSAEEIGQKMNFSRVTARRYLEYLESEGVLRLVLNYNTGGRPRRLYEKTTPTDG